ncbi:exopolysaccharide biosynthesis polyprenyl glycosylphosphotransferase [Verrucomicrobiota bacterium]
MSATTGKPVRASVIIPVYNGADTIVKCLNALQNQTLSEKQFEVIVVDDGSTDNTYGQVCKFPVNLISMAHSGPASARNKGAALARGEILVFTDADCVPEPEWLKKMLAAFDDPEVVAVKGAYITHQRELPARFARVEFETRYARLQKVTSIDFVDTYSGAFRRQAFHEVGGFDPSFPAANNEDVDLSYRIAELEQRMVFVPDARVSHTHPDTWWGYTRSKFWRGYWRMAVYRRFAGKALSDSYTPQSLKMQILALAGFCCSLPFALMSVWALAFSAAFAGLFAAACIPFCRLTLRMDPSLVPYLPVGLFLRAAALGLGVCLGVIRSPISDARERGMTAFVLLHMFLDICMLVASFGLALWLRTGRLKPLFTKTIFLDEIEWTWAICVCLWFLVLLLNRTYSSQRGKSITDHVVSVLRVSIISLAALTMLGFVFHVHGLDRGLIALFMVFSTLLLSGEKLALYSVLQSMRAGGLNVKHVLLVGKRTIVLDPLRRLTASADAGFSVIGILSPDNNEVGKDVLDTPVLGTAADLEQVLHDHPIDEVFFAVPVTSMAELEKSLAVCFRMGIQGKLIANVFEGMSTVVQTDEVLGMPFLSFLPRSERRREMITKRAMDIILALVFFVCLSPFLLIVSLLIRATTKGPAVFTQKRMGLNGRIFTMYKFRTMVEGAENLQEQARENNIMDGPVFKAPGDPRVTRFGRWLRRFSIDELPQLWNVLTGEMSLIGPRPLPVYEAKKIRGDLRRRASMKPGLTGLWQCSGRNVVNFDKWMELDLEYVDHWSLWLDIKILFKTCLVLIKGTGAL